MLNNLSVNSCPSYGKTHLEQHFTTHSSSSKAGSCSVQAKPHMQALFWNGAYLTVQFTTANMVQAQTGWWRGERRDFHSYAASPPSPCRLKFRVLQKSLMPTAMLCVNVCSEVTKRGANFAVTIQGKHARLRITLLRFPHTNHVLTWWGEKKYPGYCHHHSCLADKHIPSESCIHKTLAKETRHRMMQYSALRPLQGDSF